MIKIYIYFWKACSHYLDIFLAAFKFFSALTCGIVRDTLLLHHRINCFDFGVAAKT